MSDPAGFVGGVNYGAGYLFLGKTTKQGPVLGAQQVEYPAQAIGGRRLTFQKSEFSRRSLRIYGRGQDNSGGPK